MSFNFSAILICNRTCDKMERTAAKAWSLVSQAARYALGERKDRDFVRANLRSSIYLLSFVGFIIWLIIDVTFSRGDTFFSTSVRDAWITEFHLDADRDDGCIRKGNCTEVWRCACQQDNGARTLYFTYSFSCQDWLNNIGKDWLTRYNSTGENSARLRATVLIQSLSWNRQIYCTLTSFRQPC